MGGQRLTINATNGAETTRTTFTDGDNKVSAAWTADDKVVIVTGANSTITNTETFAATPDGTNPHNATLSGTLATQIEAGATVSGFITSSYITSSSLGSSKKQVFVDYSAQKGTFDDAMAHCLQFGSATYTGGEDIPEMHFDYKTSFFCLTLDFGNTNIAGTAQMTLTGDGLVSKSAVNTISDCGEFAAEEETEGGISISDVAVENGKAKVWIALKPAEMKNVSLAAYLDNGSIYKFAVSGSKTATLAAGKVYAFSRTGETVDDIAKLISGDGTVGSPYLIADAQQLRYIAEKIKAGKSGLHNKIYNLTSDININGEWTPIGTNGSGKMFQGTFDGCGHTITGSINVEGLVGNDGAGLFGTISSATVKNINNCADVTVTVADASKQNQFVGAIVGNALYGSTVENCSNSGKVTANAGFVGGIVGRMYVSNTDVSKSVTAMLEACRNEGIVNNTTTASAGSKSAGGIVGSIQVVAECADKVVVRGCYSTTKSNVSIPTESAMYASGIVGFVNNSVDNVVSVYACWSASSVAGKATSAIVSSASSAKYSVYDTWRNGRLVVCTVTANASGTNNNASADAPATPARIYMNAALASAGSEYSFDNNANITRWRN